MEYLALAAFLIVIAMLFVGGWMSLRTLPQRRNGSAPSMSERAAADAGRTIGTPTVGQHDFSGAVTPAHLHEVELGHVDDVSEHPRDGGL